MEQVMNQILAQLQTVNNRLEGIENEVAGVKSEQAAMRSEVASEQAEIRKEIAFYYNSTMKKLDDVRTELKSDITQIANVQRQHQDVLACINRNQ